MNELVTLSKNNENKILVRLVLTNSFLALCIVLTLVLQRAGIFRTTLSIVLILLFLPLDYYFLLLSPYKKIIFHDSSLTAISRSRSRSIPYTDIVAIREKRTNRILLVSKNNKLSILGMTTEAYSIDDKSRTANIIREEIRNRTGVTIPIVYKDR